MAIVPVLVVVSGDGGSACGTGSACNSGSICSSGGVAASAGGATTGQGGVTTKFRFSCPRVFWNLLWIAEGILNGGSVGGRNVARRCRQGAG